MAYDTWLLEFIAWKVSGSPMEFSAFRSQLEKQHASTRVAGASDADGRDSRGTEEGPRVQPQRGKDPPAWRERLGITFQKKET